MQQLGPCKSPWRQSAGALPWCGFRRDVKQPEDLGMRPTCGSRWGRVSNDFSSGGVRAGSVPRGTGPKRAQSIPFTLVTRRTLLSSGGMRSVSPWQPRRDVTLHVGHPPSLAEGADPLTGSGELLLLQFSDLPLSLETTFQALNRGLESLTYFFSGTSWTMIETLPTRSKEQSFPAAAPQRAQRRIQDDLLGYPGATSECASLTSNGPSLAHS